jgi:hypothetical protein
VARFQLGARAASALDHPNICKIHDDEYERRQFIVTELLEGQTLNHRIAGQPIEGERAAELGLRKSG